MLHKIVQYQRPKLNYGSVGIGNIILFSIHVTDGEVDNFEKSIRNGRLFQMLGKNRSFIYEELQIKTQCLVPNTFQNMLFKSLF